MVYRYTEGVNAAGDQVVSCAERIRQAGADMYAHLRGLIGNGLEGDGIATALQESQDRWNAACDEFARAEQDFGVKTKDAYLNIKTADMRGGEMIRG